MSKAIKFDPKKLAKLNNPERLEMINPDLIWQTLALKTADTLIDIGAGTGLFAKEFAKYAGKIYACDSSEIMIEWMKENLSENNILPLKSVEAAIPLEAEIADLVYMINVHHELTEPERLLKEAFRLLKSNGKIAIIDWKAQELTQGPSLAIKVPEKIIISQLEQAGFKNMMSHPVLPFHSFIIAEK